MSAPEHLYESAALRGVTGPAIRPGGLVLTERALVHCQLAPGAAVLDVGCGSGATVAHLRDHYGLRAAGLDASRRLLLAGRRSADGLALVQGRAEALPLPDGRLDALFCECVLSLLPHPEAALLEWRRVLAPRGYLVVSDLYVRSDDRLAASSPDRVRSCLAGAVGSPLLHERMQAARFEVLRFEDHTPLLKQLVARLVWAYGSLEAFWSAAGDGCGVGPKTHESRPGYYLMVARKGDDHG